MFRFLFSSQHDPDWIRHKSNKNREYVIGQLDKILGEGTYTLGRQKRSPYQIHSEWIVSFQDNRGFLRQVGLGYAGLAYSPTPDIELFKERVKNRCFERGPRTK